MKSDVDKLVENYRSIKGVSKAEAKREVATFISVFKKTLLEEKSVSIPRLMSLRIVHKEARRGINPVTLVPSLFPPTNRVKLSISPKFRELINT